MDRVTFDLFCRMNCILGHCRAGLVVAVGGCMFASLERVRGGWVGGGRPKGTLLAAGQQWLRGRMLLPGTVPLFARL